MTEARTDLSGSIADGYAPPGEYRPLGGYTILAGIFGAGLGGALVVAQRCGPGLPERYSAGDIVLTGLATYKVSRLLTKDKVTAGGRRLHGRPHLRAACHPSADRDVERARRGRRRPTGLQRGREALLTVATTAGVGDLAFLSDGRSGAGDAVGEDRDLAEQLCQHAHPRRPGSSRRGRAVSSSSARRAARSSAM
jgi:hypothetical protein